MGAAADQPTNQPSGGAPEHRGEGCNFLRATIKVLLASLSQPERWRDGQVRTELDHHEHTQKAPKTNSNGLQCG